MKQSGVVGIYLAAGSSKRMGTNKLCLPFCHTTIGCSALRTALQANFTHVIVVVKEGDCLNWIDRELFSSPYKERWSYVVCVDAAEGQSASLRCGLLAAQHYQPLGAMVLLADQPLLSLAVMNELISSYKTICQDEEIPYLAASFQGVMRPPIIFSSYIFPLVLELRGDIGARKLLQSRALLGGKRIAYHTLLDFLDIDTKEEYECWKEVKQNG